MVKNIKDYLWNIEQQLLFFLPLSSINVHFSTFLVAFIDLCTHISISNNLMSFIIVID